MEIHELPSGTLANEDVLAVDNGANTRKLNFKNIVNSLITEADLTDNPVAFTSGDAENPTEWSNVSVITTGSTLATLFNRISTMVKNVRWLYSKLGTTDISSIGGGTVTGAISALNGNTVNTVFASSDTSKYTLNNVRIVRRGRIYVLVGEIKCISPSTSSSIGIVSSGMPGVVSGVVFVPAWGAGNASKDALGVQFGDQGVFLTYGSAGSYYDLCIPMVD